MGEKEAHDAELREYRWTLSEYLLRCEQGSDIREVVAESDVDRDFYTDAFQRWQLDEVAVLDAEYIATDVREVQAEGFSYGVKGQMLTLAKRLKALKEEADLMARVAVVVDRDYDDPPADLGEFLLLTDGHSLESYAFFTSALDRFVGVFLGRGDLPSGARGAAPARRITCTGDDLRGRILPTAIRLSALRLTLMRLEPPLALFDHWIDYMKIDGDGTLSFEEDQLLRNILDAHGRLDQYETLSRQANEEAARVENDPFVLVRGHDLTSLLLKVLRSSWGRRVASSAKFALADERALTRLLLTSIAADRIDSMALFVELRRRFESP